VGVPDGEVVVTGGLGFTGSHLVDACPRAGHHLKIIDSGAGAGIGGDDHDANPRCTVVRHRFEGHLASGGDFDGAQRVVHAASCAGPAGILSRPDRPATAAGTGPLRTSGARSR
jgi:nucleoside-diphosphate-sugar epimerase